MMELREKKVKYKYNIINKHGLEEPWTGVLQGIEKANAWYNKFGKKHEAKGYKLVRHKF